MGRFAIRHWTGILLLIVLLWWALFYVPSTPSYSVFKMKQAIDARDGEAAARYVNFESVVRHAGYEMVAKESKDPMSALVGKGAVDLFIKPMAQVAKSVAVKKVNDGADEVQMPPVAVLGAVVLMRHEDGTAYTRFRDKKGREWEIRLSRDAGGVWQVSEVKNIEQLLEKLQREEQKRLNQP
jgi:hypothetical protein